MRNLAAAFLGGGIGSCARYLLQGVVQRWSGPGFPAGTLAVNILGSLVIGLLMTAMEERFLVQPITRVFLVIGVLGGFTTFSSFSFETLALATEGSYGAAGLNALLSLVCCLTATWVGMVIGRAL